MFLLLDLEMARYRPRSEILSAGESSQLRGIQGLLLARLHSLGMNPDYKILSVRLYLYGDVFGDTLHNNCELLSL